MVLLRWIFCLMNLVWSFMVNLPLPVSFLVPSVRMWLCVVFWWGGLVIQSNVLWLNPGHGLCLLPTPGSTGNHCLALGAVALDTNNAALAKVLLLKVLLVVGLGLQVGIRARNDGVHLDGKQLHLAVRTKGSKQVLHFLQRQWGAAQGPQGHR